MTDRPILFSAPMVRALLAGTKTQTRRVVKPQWSADAEPQERCSVSIPEGWQVAGHSGLWEDAVSMEYVRRCPYGVPGDRLWVRESGVLLRHAYDHDPAIGMDLWQDAGWLFPDGEVRGAFESDPPVSEWVDECSRIGRPSIHMPRWASRLTLKITAIRVERLQDISADDADAECFGGDFPEKVLPDLFPERPDGWGHLSIPECYARLWESINGPGSWAANPWVWAVSFKVVR